jgi:surface protein
MKLMKKISLLCLALLILLAKGSIFTAPSNTKSLSHFGSDPRNTLSLPPSDDRKLLTCTDGLVPSACVGCCGYKFTARELFSTLRLLIMALIKRQLLLTTVKMKCWDVSGITVMSYLFQSKALNEPIGCWNVGKVIFMNRMFYDATNFNQTIGNWNVSSVTNMAGMFSFATKFNQTIGNWNVGKVTDMQYMFYGATKFHVCLR